MAFYYLFSRIAGTASGADISGVVVIPERLELELLALGA
jgi:hypothetical protein